MKRSTRERNRGQIAHSMSIADCGRSVMREVRETIASFLTETAGSIHRSCMASTSCTIIMHVHVD